MSQFPTFVLVLAGVAILVICLEFFNAFQAYRSRRFWEKFVAKHCNQNPDEEE